MARLIRSSGLWDIDRIAAVVNPAGLDRLAAVLPPRADASYYCLVWGASGDGKFTIKSAYFLLEPNPSPLRDKVFKDIWRWRGSERIRVFMWKVALDKLPTNVLRSSWSQSSALCGFCNAGCEDILHILRDCVYATSLWAGIIKQRFVHTCWCA